GTKTTRLNGGYLTFRHLTAVDSASIFLDFAFILFLASLVNLARYPMLLIQLFQSSSFALSLHPFSLQAFAFGPSQLPLNVFALNGRRRLFLEKFAIHRKSFAPGLRNG